MTTDEEDFRDAQLFRLWIRLASTKPGKVAVAIATCVTPDEYRAALVMLARQERINLPEPPSRGMARPPEWEE